MLKTILLLCLFISGVFAQTTGRGTIAGSQSLTGLSGRHWEALPSAPKLSYIWGIHDALAFLPVVRDSQVDRRAAPLWAEGFTAEDYVKEMDAFYTNRANINIPLGYGFMACTLRLQGQVTAAELEELLRGQRKIWDSKR
jgi:hypothetical protein